MDNDNITSESQLGAAAVASEASGDKEAVSSVGADTLSLEELNKFLGKNYKDKGTALKSLKDTFSYVGKKIESTQTSQNQSSNQSSNDEVARQLKEMRTELFYSKNPQYDSPDFRAIIGRMGESPSEVVQMNEFKNIFEKASNYEKTQKNKAVLESNPRVGMVRNKMTEAKEATRAHNYTAGAEKAVGAVLDAYELS